MRATKQDKMDFLLLLSCSSFSRFSSSLAGVQKKLFDLKTSLGNFVEQYPEDPKFAFTGKKIGIFTSHNHLCWFQNRISKMEERSVRRSHQFVTQKAELDNFWDKSYWKKYDEVCTFLLDERSPVNPKQQGKDLQVRSSAPFFCTPCAALVE